MHYKKHNLFKDIGSKDKNLRKKTVTIVGISSVGSVIADMLARAGVNLRLVDRGRIETEDMLSSTLYEMEDLNKFKVKQAKKRLEVVTKDVKIKTFHEDLVPRNIFLLDSDIVIDCTNNIETSLMINEHCYKKKIPLIFCKYAGSKGIIFIVDKDACVACVEDKIKIGKIEKEGIISPTVHVTASFAVAKALKLLLGHKHEKNMISFDIWKNTANKVSVRKNPKCSVHKK